MMSVHWVIVLQNFKNVFQRFFRVLTAAELNTKSHSANVVSVALEACAAGAI
jgi:hypothetical protein